MERRERRNAVTVLAPAKLNLALDVVGLLPNGYHALDMTMQTITLYERVVLRRSAGLSLQLPGSPVQPNDKNTAIKAALEPQPDEEAKNAYFFVTDLKGSYYYARTLSEHNANCQKAAQVNKTVNTEK
mgnify:FL=1